MKNDNTTAPAVATTAPLNQKASEPTAPENILLIFGRKAFNCFLRQIHDVTGDSWKVAQVELNGREVASSKFDRIEFFTDTLIGPIVAQHEASTEEVFVTVKRPTAGIYRTAESILDEFCPRDDGTDQTVRIGLASAKAFSAEEVS